VKCEGEGPVALSVISTRLEPSRLEVSGKLMWHSSHPFTSQYYQSHHFTSQCCSVSIYSMSHQCMSRHCHVSPKNVTKTKVKALAGVCEKKIRTMSILVDLAEDL